MFSYEGDESSSLNALRVNDANKMMNYAKLMYERGGESVWDALAYVTVAHLLLHAGEPSDLFMKPDGLLYKAIIYDNKYLARAIAAAPQEYPSECKYLLKNCPQHLDQNYAHISMNQLEPIPPDLRSLGFHELNHELNILVDMSPYRVLASFDEVSSRHYRKKILIDIGMNGFYGSAKHLLDI